MGFFQKSISAATRNLPREILRVDRHVLHLRDEQTQQVRATQVSVNILGVSGSELIFEVSLSKYCFQVQVGRWPEIRHHQVLQPSFHSTAQRLDHELQPVAYHRRHRQQGKIKYSERELENGELSSLSTHIDSIHLFE